MQNALGGKPASMKVGVLLALLASLSVAAILTQTAVAATTGSVTISVVVNGGTAQPSDFKLTMKKKGSSSGITGAGNTVSFSAQPATYVITQSGPSRYGGVWSGDCNSKGEVVIAAGVAKNCTLTETYGSKPSSSGGGSSEPANPRTVRGR